MPFPTIYPLVNSVYEPSAYTNGKWFIGKRPMGVTVHYTADRDLVRLRRSLKEQKLGYHIIIGTDGKPCQLAYLDAQVSHAGNAMWREHSPNRWHAAVSVASWGKLDKDGRAWNGELVPKENVVRRKGRDGKLAYWDAINLAQQETLVNVLSWFCAMGVPAANICGHDECAVPFGRKVDPGGVLPWTMEELRGALGGIR